MSNMRVLKKEEVEQAKAEARREFEAKLVGATSKPPTEEEMDAWWGEKK